MPFMIGLMNFAVPLQLGVRDVAFPTFNSVSLWLTASAVLLVNLSLFVGEFAQTGWLVYPPLSETQIFARRRRRLLPLGDPDFRRRHAADRHQFRHDDPEDARARHDPDAHADLLLDGAGGEPADRRRLPDPDGDVWRCCCSTAISASISSRWTLGGNPMMFVNLIWAWGHPEVYILILPAFGIFSEVISTFSGKPLFGYRSMVVATMAICVLSFMVWLHHFFTMGAGADVNGFFGIMTMIIAVPTGVKIFNWLFTMWGGRVRFDTPMLWTLAFMVTFAIGGMTGVLLAVPPADFVLHNSLFLVAHFHNVLIGGVLFGAFAGYAYWFPKAFGFRLDERLGTAAFWFWIVGFYVAFMPLYVLGLEGMTRRMQHYDVAAWRPWLIVAAGGALLILAGIVLPDRATRRSAIRRRDALRDHAGDPWDGRTLEWITASPPPAFNFAVLPNVAGEEAYWGIKQNALEQKQSADRPARLRSRSKLPRNSPTGFVTAFFAVRHRLRADLAIWWLVRPWTVRRFRDLRRLRLARSGRSTLMSARGTGADRRRAARRARIAPVEGREPGITPSTYSRRERDPHKVRPPSRTAATKGPPPNASSPAYGFWIFLLSDFIMFSGFYAAYAVLSHATAGGPTARELFDLKIVALETGLLLLSSFACGMATIASNARNMPWTQVGYLVTGLLGLGFLALEVNEFARMLAKGAGPQRSAFLSAFFALVGLHGLHVTIGLLWLGTMMAQFWAKGFRADILRRGLCFALFWHALDIIWVGIFTNVYLLGTSP